MNNNELLMIDKLKFLSDIGAVAVKAEFEAEGTRTEELLRLLDIARSANFNIGLKIGGCEAIRDLIEAKQFGVNYVIAPMVETAYALKKFQTAVSKVYSDDERQYIKFLANIETITGFNNFDLMLDQDCVSNGVDGFVFGRVDFVGSMGMPLDSVDDEFVLKHVLSIAKKIKDINLDFVVGGGVSRASIDFLKSLKNAHLSRFETRKIIFEAHSINHKEIEKALLEAVHFELLWLLNKREYHKIITKEDDKRIKMLNDRWKLLNHS